MLRRLGQTIPETDHEEDKYHYHRNSARNSAAHEQGYQPLKQKGDCNPGENRNKHLAQEQYDDKPQYEQNSQNEHLGVRKISTIPISKQFFHGFR